MASVSQLLSVYEKADALAEAEVALDRIAAMEPSEEPGAGAAQLSARVGMSLTAVAYT